MSTFLNECENTILKVQDLLKQNSEWEARYEKYAKALSANLKIISKAKQNFNEWAPLYLYMNVSNAKGKMIFSLRYLGQDVANLKVEGTRIIISTKAFGKKNLRDFKCNVELNDYEWRSKEASKFRNHFSHYPKRTNYSGKKNEEHRIESLLLTEFSKKSSKNKALSRIQPIKFGGIARFQMPTPLSASNFNKLKYSGPYGGGIDILARTGKGRGTKLMIIEVKDEYSAKEPPSIAIMQGLVYATFIQRLLRSTSGESWWNIFGFKGNPPKQLALYVASAMPNSSGINDTTFKGEIIKNGADSFHLHYIYFQEKGNKINNFLTSL